MGANENIWVQLQTQFAVVLVAAIAMVALLACDSSKDPTKQPFPSTTPSPTDTVAVASATTAPTASPPLSPSSTPIPSITPLPSRLPTPTALPVSGLTDDRYDASEILALVSEQVVQVQTPSGIGSGILLSSGYVVTTTRVIWPFEQVRLQFNNGRVIEDVPVIATDLLIGVTLIGPLNIDFDLQPFVSDDTFEVGDAAFIVGFGIEEEKPDVLGIAEGEVSHWRFWEPGDFAFFHTTPSVLPNDRIGGESISGAVVSESGLITGLSRNIYEEYEGNFAYSNLVIPADDVLRITEKLIGDPNSNDLAGRGLDWSRSSSELELRFSPLHTSEVFLIEATVGANVEITASGSGDGQIAVIRSDFTELAFEEYGIESGAATVNFDVDNSMAHYLFVGNWSEETLSSTVHSTALLVPFGDPDGGVISKGLSITGFVDYFFDEDVFEIQLQAGEFVEAIAESVDFLNIYIVRESGSGLFEDVGFQERSYYQGFSKAHLMFMAPETTTYLVTVSGGWAAGYELTVYESDEIAIPTPTPFSPSSALTPTPNSGLLSQFKTEPVAIAGIDGGVLAIQAGSRHNCILTTDNAVQCWGSNESGQLGVGSTIFRTLTPLNVSGLGEGLLAISAGDSFTCALTAVGGMRCWGSNFFGQLGNGAKSDSSPPMEVGELTSVVEAIAAGSTSVCALTDGGGVMCWGSNRSGQLGNGSAIDSSIPVAVNRLSSGVSAIAAGRVHMCALTTDGRVMCWGSNFAGELGNGTTSDSNVPVDVSELSTGVQAIAAGSHHTCAVTALGGVKCWGRNGAGQLGNATRDKGSTVPVDVVGLSSGVRSVSLGEDNTCALTIQGGVKCWGSNRFGQLGDGSTDYSSIPVDVVGMSSGVTAISSGPNHTCALKIEGVVECWGNNKFGQLGID